MLQIQENLSLAPYTTLRIGGPARFFATVSTPEELLEAVRFARGQSLPVFTLGGGSNLLVTDAGFSGLVLHARFDKLAAMQSAPAASSGSVLASVAGGTDWDEFVLSICQLGLSGVECLAGIPGLVGGSPIQNIGGYGQEVAQTIHSVSALDLETLEFVVLENEACGFAYRTSIFNSSQRNRYIVLGVTFRFHPGAKPQLTYPDLQRHFGDAAGPPPLDIYHAVRGIRATKGMLLMGPEMPSVDDPDSRSAGSFFKNPVVPMNVLSRIAGSLGIQEAEIPNWPVMSDEGRGTTKLPAAWLLERAGFHKGFVLGAAGISSKHTLALINRTGTATFADIAALRDTILQEVQGRFHIRLEQEPIQLGS